MKYLIPVVMGGAGIIVGILSALGHAYAGYVIAALLVIGAAVMALITASGERTKPRIVGVRYGEHTRELGRYGLFVVNEGESAFDISIPNNQVPIGSVAQLVFGQGIPRLAKDNGEVLIDAWIERTPVDTLLGNALFDEMVGNHITDVTVNITYKDGDNRWYQTECKIERDVHAPGGITTRFVRQRRVRSRGAKST